MLTTNRPARRTLLLAVGLTLIGGPVLAWGGERVTGSGKIVTETRALTGYSGVNLNASFKLVLRASGREGVELRGDDNLLPLIETRIVDGREGRTLELRWRDGVSVSTRSEIVATVDVDKLRHVTVAGSGSAVGDALTTPSLSVRVAGSGDVVFTQLKTDDLAINLAGSGDVRITGRATKLAVAISGSGNVDTDALEADAVSVQLAGSGDAAVAARKTLAVAISGSGDVVYRGEAQPQVSVAGSGRVRRK